MKCYPQRQRSLCILQQCKNKNMSRWRAVIGITLLGVFLSASAQAAVFAVNSASDVVDANPGNGICETALGNGVCTLRAAIQETNALAGADEIILPPNTYVLTQVTELTILGNLTITGGEAATTIIDGNRIVRPETGVLAVYSGDPYSGITVNINGVSIRNGGRRKGGCHVFGSVVICGSYAAGGGIYKEGGTLTLTLTNSSVNENSASQGAGIATAGTTTILTNSMVSGNSATEGGGAIRRPAVNEEKSFMRGSHGA